MDTAGYQRFSGVPDAWGQGPRQGIAKVLILMSAWCEFARLIASAKSTPIYLRTRMR